MPIFAKLYYFHLYNVVQYLSVTCIYSSLNLSDVYAVNNNKSSKYIDSNIIVIVCLCTTKIG